MIITKPVLKSFLNYSKERIDYCAEEQCLQRDMKCLVLEYDITKNDDILYDIFLKLINLCVIKK